MIKRASDENFDGDIVRGLLRLLPGLDIVRVQDADLAGSPDPVLLAWAASEDRVLLTHDRDTMPGFAYERVRAGAPMPGVFLVSDRMPKGQAIEQLNLGRAVSLGGGLSRPGDLRSALIGPASSHIAMLERRTRMAKRKPSPGHPRREFARKKLEESVPTR